MRRKVVRWLNRYVHVGVTGLVLTLCLYLLIMQRVTVNQSGSLATMGIQGISQSHLDDLVGTQYKNVSMLRIPETQSGSLLAGTPRTHMGYITIGVPTLRRPKGEYFFNTLASLLQQSSPIQHKNMTLVVMLADRDPAFNALTLTKIKEKYEKELEEGVVLVVSAPDTEHVFQTKDIKRTFNDSLERVRWRSKQNLDYAALMEFSSVLSTYYLQVEDDVTAAPNYIQHIQDFVQANVHRPWAGLEVCPHGFIGKLFRSRDLPKLISILRTFYLEMPCDFLINHFYNLMLQRKVIRRKGNLFFHQGKYSSLGNVTRKTDKLMAGGVGVQKKHMGHANPRAFLYTSMRTYANHLLYNAYDLQSNRFFWAKDIKDGDDVTIIFDSPQTVKKVVIETGITDKTHKIKDLMRNATVEYGKKAYAGQQGRKALCTETKELGAFLNGRFEATLVDGSDIKCLSIIIMRTQTEWLVIREIAVFV